MLINIELTEEQKKQVANELSSVELLNIVLSKITQEMDDFTLQRNITEIIKYMKNL